MARFEQQRAEQRIFERVFALLVIVEEQRARFVTQDRRGFQFTPGFVIASVFVGDVPFVYEERDFVVAARDGWGEFLVAPEMRDHPGQVAAGRGAADDETFGWVGVQEGGGIGCGLGSS